MNELDWRMVSALAAFAGAWSVVLLFAVKWLLDRTQTHIDKQIEGLVGTVAKQRQDEREELRRIDRDLMSLKADLPLQYVRREDWIRFASVIDAKQDTMNEKLQRLLERKGN